MSAGSPLGIALGAMLESEDEALREDAIARIVVALDEAGTQAGAAERLGVGLRTMQRWVNRNPELRSRGTNTAKRT